MIEKLKAVITLGIEMIEVATTPEQYKGSARILSSAKELLNNVEIGRDLDRSRVVNVRPRRTTSRPTFVKIAASRIPLRRMKLDQIETKVVDAEEKKKLIVNAVAWKKKAPTSLKGCSKKGRL